MSLRLHWFLLLSLILSDLYKNIPFVVSQTNDQGVCSEDCTAYNPGSWPPCPLFQTNGIVDPYLTIVRCTMYYIPAGMNPVSYFTGKTINVTTGMGINNLMEIDEVQGTCLMDIFFRMYWNEPRLNLTNLFEVMVEANPNIMNDGIDLSSYYQDNPPLQSDPQLFIPDINFIDAKSIDIIATKVTVFPNGYIFYSQHMVLETVQPLFNYHDYPVDSQIIQIRLENYAIPDNIVRLTIDNQSITFIENENYEHQPIMNFAQSKIWEYQSSYVYKTIAYYHGLPFDRLIFDIEIRRRSKGLIMRLAFPIMLLLVLVCLTYWADTEVRVESTVTILLAVSALYIVIFDNIPMLGYLTRLDKYILNMFIMLVVAVFSHQVVCVYDKRRQEENLPLSGFLARAIETIGRGLIFPYVCITFETYLLLDNADEDMQSLADILWTMIAVYFAFIYPYEAWLLYKHWDETVDNIRDKIDKEGTPDHRNYTITINEKFFFNLWYYGHLWDFTTEHHRTVKQMDYDDTMAQYEANKKSLERSNSSFDEGENLNVTRRINPIHNVVNAVAFKSSLKKKINNDGLGTDKAFSATSVPVVASDVEMTYAPPFDQRRSDPLNQKQLDPHQFERKTDEPNSDDEC